MDYFDDEDYYGRRSPGLNPVYPKLRCATPPSFDPLWLPENNAINLLAPVVFEQKGDGREARRRLYDDYETPMSIETEFEDIFRLQHLAPTLALRSNLDTGTSNDDQQNNWPYPSRYDDSPFTFKRTPKPFQLRASNLKKTRLGLPITLNTSGTAATVLACADTGADSNIISEELARALGYTQYETLPVPKKFVLANGKTVDAIGQITSSCAFGIETDISVSMSCVFYVFLKAVTPIIMGMQFLEETETMTKHRERLVRVPRPALQALSVCSINRPRKLLSCNLDQNHITATPDTGSEIDLISPLVASELGMLVHPGEEVLELADGSKVVTSGYVRASLSLRDSLTRTGELPDLISTTVDLFVLKDLVHRILLGEETLEILRVFTENQYSLRPAFADENQIGLNAIRHLGTMDRLLNRVKEKLGLKQSASITKVGETDMQGLRDQQENDRREQEAKRIATLPTDEQQAAIDAELALQCQYDNNPKDLSPDLSIPTPSITSLVGSLPLSATITEVFRCNYPGCNALPFPTQYLLNSHTNVHSQNRPHFCPAAGCPRSEGGKGFKRKNEMIRHGLVHQNPGYMCPGYVCPFCLDREHKYPRPDQLQRHVRVHHQDKKRDDPELRYVLARRP